MSTPTKYLLVGVQMYPCRYFTGMQTNRSISVIARKMDLIRHAGGRCTTRPIP